MKTRQFSSRWFRFYDEVVDDPKVQTLGDKLGFFWMNCLCLASKNDGILPPLKDIAWKLRKPESQIAAMVASLHERGLLDREADSFTPHNWQLRQYASDVSTERVRRFREKTERSRNADETFPKRSETATETVPEQTDRQTQTQKQTAGDVAVSLPPKVVQFGTNPKTGAAVRSKFSAAGVRVIAEIADACTQAYLCVSNPKIPPPTDQDIADAVEDAWRQQQGRKDPQRSAILFKTTAAEVIKTWAELGRHPPSESGFVPKDPWEAMMGRPLRLQKRYDDIPDDDEPGVAH
jgi:hypothetical protein